MKKTQEHGLEIFKQIKGYEGLYQISDCGNVKSLAKNKLTRWGIRITKQRFLKVDTFHPKGYRYVTLIKDGIRKSHSVHRLMAIAFIPNPKNLPQINHEDCIKDNNVINNLKWCDNSYNQIHAFKNGLNKPRYGEDHPLSKVTEQQVLEIRKLYSKTTLTHGQIGDMYNIKKWHVGQIVNRITWNHI